MGAGFRLVPITVVGGPAGVLAGITEKTGRVGVWKHFGVCFTGVLSGIGEEDGGNSDRECDGD